MVHLFFYGGITVLLLIIIKKISNMPTLADFQAAFAEINTTTNNIAADIERLAGQIGSGMTEAEETQALNELQGIAERLRTIAETTPEPEGPTPEGEV